MSTLALKHGVKHSYKPLALPLPGRITILLVIDGLGYRWLEEHGQGSMLASHTVGALTSVFPSTTAAAMTALTYGVPPQQHGVTGWYMLAPEFAGIVRPLPFLPMMGSTSYESSGIARTALFPERTFAEQLPVRTITLHPRKITSKDRTEGKHSFLGYETPAQMIRLIKKAAQESKGKTFIFAYWDGFDALCHQGGTQSEAVHEHFLELDGLIGRLKIPDATLLITADHGMIDSPLGKQIHLEKHPAMQHLLTLPLSGEPRAAYAYVRAHKAKEFESYVRGKLSHALDLYRSDELLASHVFGLGKPHPRLHQRIGDYVLVMKDDYVIGGALVGRKASFFRANHGGVSEQEMLVPLIMISR